MVYVPTETNHWVDENFARLAEIIRDYDPNLEFRWIPPDKRVTKEDKSKPYCVVDTRTNSIVFYASELDTPEDILTKIFHSDNKHGNVLKRLDARNAAIQALKMKAWLDYAEEAKEQSAFLMGTKKNYIRHNGFLLDDQLRKLRRLK